MTLNLDDSKAKHGVTMPPEPMSLNQISHTNSKTRLFIGVLAVISLLLWRIFYGLSQNFWHEDVVQIYLLGLKYATTGLWPYFGPDIVHTNQQIPGALQSLIIGLPLRLTQAAEAPFVVVNVLSLMGLALLSWYLARRFTQFSSLLLLIWLATLPSTLQISTNTYNPSYLLFPACLFFVGWFESQAKFRTLHLSAFSVGASMGFALMFTFQLHMSWPLFFPFVLSAIVLPSKELSRVRLILGLTAGAALVSTLLIPTLIAYGASSLWTAGASNSGLHLSQLLEAPAILARYVSLGSYEFFGFNLSATIEERRQFILESPILILSAIALAAGLLWQFYLTLRMVTDYARNKNTRYPEYTLFLLVLLWVAMIFMLTPRPPVLRNFYLMFPVVVLAMVRLFNDLGNARVVKRLLKGLIAASIVFHSVVGITLMPDVSLYRDRLKIQCALQAADYRIFGERRPGRY
jgi:hypothetical protein